MEESRSDCGCNGGRDCVFFVVLMNLSFIEKLWVNEYENNFHKKNN